MPIIRSTQVILCNPDHINSQLGHHLINCQWLSLSIRRKQKIKDNQHFWVFLMNKVRMKSMLINKRMKYRHKLAQKAWAERKASKLCRTNCNSVEEPSDSIKKISHRWLLSFFRRTQICLPPPKVQLYSGFNHRNQPCRLASKINRRLSNNMVISSYPMCRNLTTTSQPSCQHSTSPSWEDLGHIFGQNLIKFTARSCTNTGQSNDTLNR